MIDFKLLMDLADKLGVIQVVKDKLLRQPDPAADKLVVVLAELSKVYGVIGRKKREEERGQESFSRSCKAHG